MITLDRPTKFTIPTLLNLIKRRGGEAHQIVAVRMRIFHGIQHRLFGRLRRRDGAARACGLSFHSKPPMLSLLRSGR